MKYLTLIFCCWCLGTDTFAQNIDFAPVGAKWYYEESSTIWPYPGIYSTLECTEETVFQGKLCRKLEGFLGYVLPNPCYVFSQHDSVFYYSLHSEQFELLYDFGALPGESWYIRGLSSWPVGSFPDSALVMVDSISQRILGADTLKVWHITYPMQEFDWGTEIIEGVGNTCLLCPVFDLYESQVCGVRCYSDPNMDLHFVDYPCDAIISDTENPSLEDNIHIDPNPCSSYLNVALTSGATSAVLQMYDLNGRLVQTYKLQNGDNSLAIMDLPSGMYFYKIIGSDGNLLSGRIMKE